MNPSPSPTPDPPAPSLFKRLGAAGPVAIVMSTWPPLGGFLLLATLTSLGPWLRGQGTQGMVYYFLITGFLMGISFVPTYSCAILAGWAFGFAVGWPLAVVTITAASVIAYAIGRWVARDRVLEVVRERPKWDAVYRALFDERRSRALLVITLLRLPPTSPFALANLVLAAAKVRLPEYTIGTLVGIAPRTALGAFIAAGLEQLDLKAKGQTWTLIAGIVVTLIVVAVIGHMANRALAQITRRDEAAQ